MKRAEFERLLLLASSRAEECGTVDPLPEALATVAAVASVQTRIDHYGGLLCFFEEELAGGTAYEHFSAAYRRIGATAAADVLDKAVRLFPFDAPHLHRDKRMAWLEGVRESGGDHEMWSLSDELVENPEVWAKLKAYVEANRQVFPTV